MQTLDELIAAAPVFDGLAREQLKLIAGCARNVHVAAGTLPVREGDPADTLLPDPPGRGRARGPRARGQGALVIETLENRRRRRLVVAVRALPLAARRARDRAVQRWSRSTAPACAASARPTMSSATS